MIRDTTIYVFSRALPALLSLSSIALLTHFLSPEEFGRYSLAITLAGFLNVLLMTWNLQAFYRLHSIYRGRRAAVLDGATSAGFVVSVVTGTVLVGLALPFFATDFGWDYCVGALALFPALAALELNSFRLNVGGLPWKYFTLQLARAAGNLLAGGLVAYLTGSVALVLVAVAIWWLVAASLSGMARWITLVRFRGEHIQTMRRMLRYGAPLTAAAALYSGVSMMERFMLDRMAGPEAVGQLAAGTDIVQFSVGAIGSAIALSAYPRLMALYSRNGGQLKEELTSYSSYQMAIVLPLVVGLVLVARPFSELLIGRDIRDGAAAVMPWAAAGILFSVLKGFYLDFSFQLTRWTMGTVIVAAIMILTVFVLNLVLIPLNGAVGTAQASLAGFVVAVLLTYVLGRLKALPMPFNIADLAKIGLAAAVMAGAVQVTSFSPPMATLIAKSVVGAVVYAGVLLILNPFHLRGIGRRFLNRVTGRQNYA